MWGPLLEKAWAKLRGGYIVAREGMIINAVRSIVNAPIFTYFSSELTTTQKIDDLWTLFATAYTQNYIMGGGAINPSASGLNQCGLKH